MGKIYFKHKKNQGQIVNFLFDSRSSINVIPLFLIKSIGAKYTSLKQEENDFTSCNNTKVEIIGKMSLYVIFKDNHVRYFTTYIASNIYEQILSFKQMLDWALTNQNFPFKQTSLN